MRSVGIRELRQNASRVLREVEAGEVFEITDRGRPVAHLTPVPRGGTLARLRAEGRIIPPTRRLEDLPPPLKPKPGVPLPGELIERDRLDER
ncbi:MAG TPA: type II toxin-antitoxin system prevent-host-death family antitoxin [Solirubrobacteraceae bacterium]|nr:type II toxin-antitoxin system prevent-host-death family antitoxin [Solirubrobacteraceae bacterium]